MTPTKGAKGAKSAKPAKKAAPARKKAAAAKAPAAKAAGSAARPLVTVRQLRRAIDKKQELALQGLGLRRIRHEVSREDTPSIRGLILKVRHLVEIVDAK
jgi:large subunit ribosomal protein L30